MNNTEGVSDMLQGLASPQPAGCVLSCSNAAEPACQRHQHPAPSNGGTLGVYAVLQVLDAKSKAEEAAATSAAALSAAERKAKAYRGDSTALLTDYDAWVQNLLAKKSN